MKRPPRFFDIDGTYTDSYRISEVCAERDDIVRAELSYIDWLKLFIDLSCHH